MARFVTVAIISISSKDKIGVSDAKLLGIIILQSGAYIICSPLFYVLFFINAYSLAGVVSKNVELRIRL